MFVCILECLSVIVFSMSGWLEFLQQLLLLRVNRC